MYKIDKESRCAACENKIERKRERRNLAVFS